MSKENQTCGQMTEDELEELEEAAMRSVMNYGEAKDIWHPDYGWIMRDGKPTEEGMKFYETELKDREEKK